MHLFDVAPAAESLSSALQYHRPYPRVFCDKLEGVGEFLSEFHVKRVEPFWPIQGDIRDEILYGEVKGFIAHGPLGMPPGVLNVKKKKEEKVVWRCLIR
jgi:hypothetical protein